MEFDPLQLAWALAELKSLGFTCRRYDMDLRDERELAFQRLLSICQSGLVSITDFRSSLCSSSFGCKTPSPAPRADES